MMTESEAVEFLKNEARLTDHPKQREKFREASEILNELIKQRNYWKKQWRDLEDYIQACLV